MRLYYLSFCLCVLFTWLFFFEKSKAKAENDQAVENSMSGNSCQLCAAGKLNFELPPKYCGPCGSRINRNEIYYSIVAGATLHLCNSCHDEARGNTIIVDGTPTPKASLEKKKNEETEELV